MKQLRAAFEAEYAGMFQAGTMARLDPVLRFVNKTFNGKGYRILVTHKTILVGDGFDWRNGRKMVVRLTKLVKLTLIS